MSVETTIPTKFTDGKIRVFWDVTDFPVPEGRRIREIVDSVLKKRGYKAEASIKAYGGTDPDEDNPLESGIIFLQKRDKYWRLHSLLVDFALAAAENHKPHYHYVPLTLMVVAKNIKEDTEFVHLLQNVNAANFNVLLVLPDVYDPKQVTLADVNLVWRWTSLLEGGDPMPETELQALIDQGGKRECFFPNIPAADVIMSSPYDDEY
ncbi:hypothetical protein CARUB_v10010308mg [Capsella rubella]|uniref:NYN domain-containing protein n=1 Tax=Capsella rubella TaxID=81985 RepID=R0I874_9BRAS|nr:uncharacterized protein LOC17897178 [Capsella rubella]EOA38519.1 hypothetical protein CARUB_v10010308mg [Capsella rubella]